MQKANLKSRLLTTAIIALFCSIVSAQTVVNPGQRAKSNRNIEIDRIELNEDYTIIYVGLNDIEMERFMVPSSTYIVSASGGKKYKIIKAKGIELDKVNYNFKHREVKLYFPALSYDVKEITYRSGSDEWNWNFYDIDLDRKRDDNYYKAPVIKSVVVEDGKEKLVIENPSYKAASAHNLKLNKIEITDDKAVLCFSYENNNSFSIPRGSCIQEGDGGKLLYVKDMESGQVFFDTEMKGAGKYHYNQVFFDTEMTGVGKYYYNLIFPPISKDAKIIHFKENNRGGDWFIYDIDVSRE